MWHFTCLQGDKPPKVRGVSVSDIKAGQGNWKCYRARDSPKRRGWTAPAQSTTCSGDACTRSSSFHLFWNWNATAKCKIAWLLAKGDVSKNVNNLLVASVMRVKQQAVMKCALSFRYPTINKTNPFDCAGSMAALCATSDDDVGFVCFLSIDRHCNRFSVMVCLRCSLLELMIMTGTGLFIHSDT